MEHSMQQKKLKIKAWDLLSKIIRLKYSDPNGYASCVSCGLTKHWTELHAGHFIPKSAGNAVYFLEINIYPQCAECNISMGGNLKKYEQFILEAYGQELLDKLKKAKNDSFKITENDYKEMIVSYKQRLKLLLQN